MKPVAYALTWVFLIFATYWNAFFVYHLFGEREFFDFLGTLFTAPVGLVAGAIAFSAIQVGTANKPFAMHPVLSVLTLLNVAFPVGRLVTFFTG